MIDIFANFICEDQLVYYWKDVNAKPKIGRVDAIHLHDYKVINGEYFAYVKGIKINDTNLVKATPINVKKLRNGDIVAFMDEYVGVIRGVISMTNKTHSVVKFNLDDFTDYNEGRERCKQTITNNKLAKIKDGKKSLISLL